MEAALDWEMVTSEFREFHWSVAVRGYHVLRVSDKKNPKAEQTSYLFNVSPLSRTPIERFYQPMAEYPELFRTFAKLDPYGEESILAFANQYGLLQNNSGVGVRSDGQGEKIAEGLDLWGQEIKAMKFAVNLWHIVEHQNHQELSRIIEWRKHKNTAQVIFHEGNLPNDLRPARPYLITSSERVPILLEWFQPEDVVLPAKYYLARFINTRLSGHVITQLLWTTSEKEELRYRRIHTPYPSPDLRVVPRSLLGVLWLQLALLVGEKIEHRRCLRCGKIIVIGGGRPGTFRSNKKTCSNACRTAACRNRKKEQGKAKTRPRAPHKRAAKKD